MQVPDSFHAALRAAAFVSQMAILTAAGALGGWYLDGWLETDPVFVLLLGGLGFVAGLYTVWRAFSAAMTTDEDDTAEDPDPPAGNDPGP